MSSEKKHLRILCLGASLVYGYSGEGTIEHPFSQNLAKILRAALPDTDIDIVVDGVPGDLVTSGTFVKRMQSQCMSHNITSLAHIGCLHRLTMHTVHS